MAKVVLIEGSRQYRLHTDELNKAFSILISEPESFYEKTWEKILAWLTQTATLRKKHLNKIYRTIRLVDRCKDPHDTILQKIVFFKEIKNSSLSEYQEHFELNMQFMQEQDKITAFVSFYVQEDLIFQHEYEVSEKQKTELKIFQMRFSKKNT